MISGVKKYFHSTDMHIYNFILTCKLAEALFDTMNSAKKQLSREETSKCLKRKWDETKSEGKQILNIQYAMRHGLYGK